MHLDVDSLAALTTMRQAEIRREVAGYRLARQARGTRCPLRLPLAGGVWRAVSLPATVAARLLAGPARRPIG